MMKFIRMDIFIVVDAVYIHGILQNQSEVRQGRRRERLWNKRKHRTVEYILFVFYFNFITKKSLEST